MKPEADPEDSPSDRESAAPGGPGGPSALAALPAPGRGALALSLLWAVLAAAAFGPMLTFDPEPSLVTEVEGVFFTPSDTSPAVVLLLAAWLLYRRWDRLKRVPLVRGPAWLCAGLLGLAGGLLSWSTYVGARDLRTLALMLTLQGLGCLFGGPRAMRLLAVPTAFLLFAVPMPAPLLNAVLSHMQYWTAEFTGLLLHAMGRTAFVAGDELVLVDNVFVIIETCSGVRITETLTMLTILMLDLFHRRGLHAAILLLAAPAVAFLCNAGRAVTIILNPHGNIAEIHTLQGIGMLLAGLLLLYAIDGLLDGLLSRRVSAAVTPASPVAVGSPVDRRTVASATGVLAIFAAIALLLPPWPVYPQAPIPNLLRNLEEIPGWSSSELKPDYRYLGRIGIQRDLSRRYRRHGEAVDLYLGVGNRSVRPRSVLFTKILLPGSGRYIEAEGPIDLGPAGSEATWRVAATKSHRFLVISWQEAAGSLVAETVGSFLGFGRSPLRRAGGEPLAVRITTKIDASDPDSRARAEARLLEFYAALRPELDALQAVLRGDTF